MWEKHRVEGLACGIDKGGEGHGIAFAGAKVFHCHQLAQHPIALPNEVQHLAGHQLATEVGFEQVEPSEGYREAVKFNLIVGVLQSVGLEVGELKMLVFKLESQHFEFPSFSVNALQNAYDEIELFGFPVSLTWFDLLKTNFRGELMACQMLNFVGQRYRMLGKLVTVKNFRTCKGDPMALATFVDATGEAFDTVLFPQVFKNYPFQGDGMYLLLGKVTEEFGQPSLEVEKMGRLEYKTLE